jgi:hypothetical protein
MARPSKYTDGLAAIICDHLANGVTLTAICSRSEMPGYSTVMRWLGENQAFRDRYARAREMQADFFAEKALTEAMNATNENANAKRVQLDAIKWFAAKAAPKKYGDKLDVAHTGNVNVSVVRYSDPTS